jgi:hypothetical protein
MPSALTFEEKHHPAKYSGNVLETIRCLMDDWGVTGRVLDPYAGVGWIHRLSTLDRPTFAVEIENPWAANQGHAGRTVQGDAGSMGFFADDTFTAIATSAVYMNRMRDHHEARDSSKRLTYKHQLAALTPEPIHAQNMGAMTNTRYRKAAQSHIREFRRVVVPEGLAFLNLSNSIDDGTETNCVEQWLNWLTLANCRIREMVPVSTRRLGFGANRDARAEHEVVIVAQFPPARAQSALL